MADLLGVAVSTAKAHEWEAKTPENGSSSNGKLPPKSPKLTPVKIITVGDAGVGKTRLLARFAAEKDLEPKATVGVEALTKKVTLAGGRTIKAQMWDTAGQERYRAITRAHFRRAHCTTLVYDITRKDTLDHAKQWLEELRTEAPDSIILLVGNKSDLADQRAVTKEQGEKFARDNGIVAKDGTPLHIETSALQPDTVFKAFDVLFRGERRGGHETMGAIGSVIFRLFAFCLFVSWPIAPFFHRSHTLSSLSLSFRIRNEKSVGQRCGAPGERGCVGGRGQEGEEEGRLLLNACTPLPHEWNAPAVGAFGEGASSGCGGSCNQRVSVWSQQ